MDYQDRIIVCGWVGVALIVLGLVVFVAGLGSSVIRFHGI